MLLNKPSVELSYRPYIFYVSYYTQLNIFTHFHTVIKMIYVLEIVTVVTCIISPFYDYHNIQKVKEIWKVAKATNEGMVKKNSIL